MNLRNVNVLYRNILLKEVRLHNIALHPRSEGPVQHFTALEALPVRSVHCENCFATLRHDRVHPGLPP